MNSSCTLDWQLNSFYQQILSHIHTHKHTFLSSSHSWVKCNLVLIYLFWSLLYSICQKFYPYFYDHKDISRKIPIPVFLFEFLCPRYCSLIKCWGIFFPALFSEKAWVILRSSFPWEFVRTCPETCKALRLYLGEKVMSVGCKSSGFMLLLNQRWCNLFRGIGFVLDFFWHSLLLQYLETAALARMVSPLLCTNDNEKEVKPFRHCLLALVLGARELAGRDHLCGRSQWVLHPNMSFFIV